MPYFPHGRSASVRPVASFAETSAIGKPVALDASAEDLDALRTRSREDLFDAFTIAFRFGFCMGGRAALKGKFKEKKRAKVSADGLSQKEF